MLAGRWQPAAIFYLFLLASIVTYGAGIGMLLAQQVWEADRDRQRLAATLDHPGAVAGQEERWLATHPRPYQTHDAWLGLFRAYGGWWLGGITFGVYLLWTTGALWELELRRSLRRRPPGRHLPSPLPPPVRASRDSSIW